MLHLQYADAQAKRCIRDVPASDVSRTSDEPMHGKEHSLEVILPALSIVVLKPKRVYGVPKS